eukprot:1144780-Pelagomonas_calceolata.AAC.3
MPGVGVAARDPWARGGHSHVFNLPSMPGVGVAAHDPWARGGHCDRLGCLSELQRQPPGIVLDGALWYF